MDTPDIYKDIFTTADAMHAQMGAFLQQYVRVDDITLEVTFIRNLTARRRIVLYLLTLRALKYLGRRDSDSATPRQIADAIHINRSTARVELRNLLQARIISRSHRVYFVDTIQSQAATRAVEA